VKRSKIEFYLDDGRRGIWVQKHPKGRRSQCQSGHTVHPKAPRAWIDDFIRGTQTLASKGKPPRVYYCEKHATALGAPPPPTFKDPEALFE